MISVVFTEAKIISKLLLKVFFFISASTGCRSLESKGQQVSKTFLTILADLKTGRILNGLDSTSDFKLFQYSLSKLLETVTSALLTINTTFVFYIFF